MSVYMFPGQGAQTKGMGADLFELFPDLTEAASRILGYSIRELCLEDPRRELSQTRYTQPALYVVNALSYRKRVREGGARPHFLLGHSLGEYNALEAAGAIGFEDGLRLVCKRGELMSEAQAGAMAAVIGLSEEAIRDKLETHGLAAIDIANLNGPAQIILSGLRDDVAQAQTVFQTDGARYVPLNTSGAFHSRYMEPARVEFERFLRGFRFAAPSVPVISNVEAKPYQADRVRELLAAQMTQPVQWARSVQYLLARGEHEFVELGPGRVLARLVAEIQKHPLPAAPIPTAAVPLPIPLYDPERERVALHESIERWNRRYPIGTRVVVENYRETLKTRTQAMPLLGLRAVIYMEGYKGYFELSDVHPLSDALGFAGAAGSQRIARGATP